MLRPNDTLETERLRLRRFTPDDFELYARLGANPHVMRFAGGVKTREQSAESFKTRVLDYYEQFPGLGRPPSVRREKLERACVSRVPRPMWRPTT